MRFVPGFVPEGGGLDAAGQQFIHRPRAWLSQPTSGQRLRKPCRNPGHLRYPRLHPTCSQAACQGKARAPQSTMTKVGKSHSKGTFAGAFGNDEDARLADIDVTTISRLRATKPDINGSGYSITSSARARINGGIVRPSGLAVLRLMMSLNVVGCSIGRSAG